MAIRTPGFTVLGNLKQNDIRATEMLTNLFSREETIGFSAAKGAGSDLQVFQNNVNNQSTYSHRNLNAQGEDHKIANFIVPFVGRIYFQISRPNTAVTRSDLANDFEIELNGEDYTPRIRPTIFDSDGFNLNGVADYITDRTDVHLVRFGSFHFLGIPKTYFSSNAPDSPPNNLTPLSLGDPIKLFETGGDYSLSFVNDEMKISVPGLVETFTESDTITKISFGAIDDNTPPAETNTDFTGTFTIKEFQRDRDTGAKSFIIGGKTFTSAEQTAATTAFDQSSIIITRKNGVTAQAFLNVGEYATELYDDSDSEAPVTLYQIDKDKTYVGIFSDINSNIDSAEEKVKKLVIRREDNDILDRVKVKGIVRFSDQQNNVSEENDTIPEIAPGLFLLKSVLDTPRKITRAFSETSSLWEVNSNTIRVKSGQDVTKAEIGGKLIFEEGINIDVDDDSPPLEILDQSPHADANGVWNDSLGIATNDETFTHRMVLEVDEIDAEGDAVTVQYGILAVRAD
tara:strand:+ start:19021 stop:20559 length:1539 start_codon:yes stop_codon:yes gene_type:complete